MSRIRGKNTKPEVLVRKWLWSQGFRYRLNVAWMPGKPDIVIHKLRTVIFVNGCFWHGHNVERIESGILPINQYELELTDSECCRIPQSNRAFWLRKINRNRERDLRIYQEYQQAGWHVLVVWECSLRPKRRDETLNALSLKLCETLLEQNRKPVCQPYEEEETYSVAAEEQAPYGED